MASARDLAGSSASGRDLTGSSSEFARIYIHGGVSSSDSPAAPSLMSSLVSSATSAAFKLSSTTTASELMDLVCKKFQIPASHGDPPLRDGTVVVAVSASGLPAFVSSFQVEQEEPDPSAPQTSGGGDRSNRPLLAGRGGLPSNATLSLVKTLKPSDSPLAVRDELLQSFSARAAAHNIRLPELQIKWFYKRDKSPPLDLEGDVSGTEDSDDEDEASATPAAAPGAAKAAEAAQEQATSQAPAATAVATPTTLPSAAALIVAELLAGMQQSAPSSSSSSSSKRSTRSAAFSILPPTSEFLKVGYLRHRSSVDDNIWRRKWAILTADRLYLVGRRHSRHSKRVSVVPLIRNHVRDLDRSPAIPFGLEVATARRCHLLAASSKAEQQAWSKAISSRMAIASDNNFVDLAELIVSEEEHARAKRLHAVLETLVKECGVPGLGGATWNRTGAPIPPAAAPRAASSQQKAAAEELAGGSVVDLVRLEMAVQRYKEVVRHVGPSGPSWVGRLAVGKQWNEAARLVGEFFGDGHGHGDILKGYPLDSRRLDEKKLVILTQITTNVDKFERGEKVQSPDEGLFDDLVKDLRDGARQAAEAERRRAAAAAAAAAERATQLGASGGAMQLGGAARGGDGMIPNPGDIQAQIKKGRSSTAFQMAAHTAMALKKRSQSITWSSGSRSPASIDGVGQAGLFLS